MPLNAFEYFLNEQWHFFSTTHSPLCSPWLYMCPHVRSPCRPHLVPGAGLHAFLGEAFGLARAFGRSAGGCATWRVTLASTLPSRNRFFSGVSLLAAALSAFRLPRRSCPGLPPLFGLDHRLQAVQPAKSTSPLCALHALRRGFDPNLTPLCPADMHGTALTPSKNDLKGPDQHDAY